MQLSLLDEGGLDLHTGLTSAYSSKSSDGQWMAKNQEFEKEQEAIVTTQCEDNDVNAKVLQNKNRNGNKRVYECHVCLKRFGAPSKLKRHCLIHTNQRPFQCSICFRAFRECSHLKVHFRSHTNPSSPVTTARKRIFPVSKSSDRMCTLQLKKKSGYQCEICLKKFSFPSKLTRHLFVHFDVKAYTCTICRKSFKQAYYLHKHLKVHTEKRNGNSRLCRSEHGQEASVLQRKNSNVNKRVYDCPVCHKRVGASSELKRHCLIHMNQRPFQCSICCRVFRERSHLKVHCLIHTNQRPFQCSICCRAFRERSHLKVHIRTHINPVKRTRSLHSYKDNSHIACPLVCIFALV
uniref:Zinc finger protein Xfin-like n=1 Tax=Sinocyclocheilus anshuiensis TaxID=1608454 RepID=A0A671LZ78_9TELE